jgi:Mg/Co/Ni transporter MgtE
MLRALSQQTQEAPVSEVMQREFEVADSFDMLEVAFARLQSCACRTIPVLRMGQLVGLVTMDGIGEFLRIQAALGPTRT